MGNTLSASNPAEILPVEAYLADLGDSFESLGSTRFMKVARARNADSAGLNVFKVFLIQDDTNISLDFYRSEIMRIRDALVKAPNCSTIRKIYHKPKYAILVRQYQKLTLSDRLSTRPFINYHERLWYIYQLFKALSQCQKANVCHGDLKSQNIMISSSNWLQITDFAPYKPTYLPSDNPSSFTFFFDTSRRQSCYLAPERFLTSSDYEAQVKLKGDSWLFSSLTHSMDMFSAGCVVYELLCEGKAPFSYGELCEYRSMTSSEAALHLDRLLGHVPSIFRPLLKMLLNREPAIRMTAQQVLDGTALHFPSAMESFFNYLNVIRPRDLTLSNSTEGVVYGGLEPDDVIAKLKRDEKSIWDRLEESDDTRPLAVLFVSLITANLRALRSSQAKVDAMNLLVRLSAMCDSAISTDRVLPYLVFLLSDPSDAVRVFAIESIVALTKPLEPSSVEDSLVFIDYLLPEFTALVDKRQHTSPTHVLIALASNLGTIAQTAHRFLVAGRGLRNGTDDECSGAENLSEVQQWEDESVSLAKSVADLFVLLCGEGNNVRHSLLHPQSLSSLYSFFSKMGNNDILLHHMITFLNTKSDWQLRAAFFDTLPICVQKKSVDVFPLLCQGLHDFEELVVIRALNCISALVAADFLDRATTVQLLKQTTPFLAHPNEWIRVSVVNLIVLLDSRWSLADIHSKLLPEVRPYMKDEPLLRCNHKVVVINSLKDPISREIWSRIMKYLNAEQTRQLLAHLDKCVQKNAVIPLDDYCYSKVFIRDAVELELIWKITRFNHHLVKMVEFNKTAGMETQLTMQRGIVDLSSHNNANVKRNVYSYNKKRDIAPLDARSVGMNSEWNEMFGSGPAEEVKSLPPIQAAPVTNRTTGRVSVCSAQLRDLLSHKEDLFVKAKGPRKYVKKDQASHPSKINGTLITHIHEHTDKVTQMSLHSDGQRFASVSLDGTVRLWNIRTITGECYGAVRSDAAFPIDDKVHPPPPLQSVDWAGNGSIIALAATDGQIVWADVSATMTPLSKVQLPSDEGPPEQIYADNNLLFVRTHHSVIYCLDFRVGKSEGPLKMHEVWRREVGKNYGLVSSFCVDPWRSNWMTLACTNRQLMLWDMRYQQEVMSWNTPSKMIPLKLWSNPSSSSASPEVFVAFNSRGDVSSYDLSKPEPTRNRVLWSSIAPPLQYDQQQNVNDEDFHNLTGALCVCEKTATIFTGDSLGALRKWSPSRALGCEYLSGPRKIEGRAAWRISYSEQPEQASKPAVIYETRMPNKEVVEKPPVPLETKASSFHRTAISDVLCMANGEFLASAAVDGIIKIWK